MKILITGGMGYIGTELIKTLTPENAVDEILIYDNFSRDNHGLFLINNLELREKIQVIEGDLLDSRKLKEVTKQVDMVVHLAAKVSTPYITENHHGYDQVNNWGTAELVYAIEDAPNIKKLIHLSSTAVYGFSDTEVDETNKALPNRAYSISKYRAEGHIQRLISYSNINTLILRSGNVFGFSESMRFTSVINRFVFNAKYLKKITVHGSGEQIRPFIDVKDLVKIIKHALLGSMESGLYNVFDDNLKIIDIARVLQDVFPGLEIQYLNQHVNYGSLIVKSNPQISKILAYKKSLSQRVTELINSLL